MYSEHLKSSHGGFLSDKQRKRLLRMKKKERETPDSDFWWRIKESTRDTMMDMKLICDVASEQQLQEIFGEKISSSKTDDVYPITLVLSSLLPNTQTADILRQTIIQLENSIESAKIDLVNQKDRPDEVKRLQDWLKNWEPIVHAQKRQLPIEEEKLKEQEWRKHILEDLAVKILKWYLASGIFQTDSHRRMIIDTLDTITIMSSGKKINLRHDPDQLGLQHTWG